MGNFHDNILEIFDVFLIIFGIYTMYSTINMKKTGIIPNWLIMKDEIPKCKDNKGFITFVYHKTILFSLFICIFGAICMLNTFVFKMKYIDTIGLIVFFIVLIWFGIYLSKGKKQFF